MTISSVMQVPAGRFDMLITWVFVPTRDVVCAAATLGVVLRPEGTALGVVARLEDAALGVVTRPEGTALGVVTRVEGAVLGVVTRAEGTALGVVTRLEGAALGVVTRPEGTVVCFLLVFCWFPYSVSCLAINNTHLFL